MRKTLTLIFSLALAVLLLTLPFTVAAAGDVTATFDGLHADMTIAAGGELTLPTATGVSGWAQGGRYYAPGDKVTLTENTAFTPLLTDLYFAMQGYDSATLWQTTTLEDFETPTGNFYSHFYLGENWQQDRVLVWNTSRKPGNTHTYQEEGGILTISKSIAEGNKGNNFIQIFSSQSFPKLEGYSSAKARIYSFDIQYTAGKFNGMKVGWNSWDLATRIFLHAKTDGSVMLGNQSVGTLKDGWNNIKFYVMASADETYCDIYCELNGDAVESDFATDTLKDMTHIASSSIASTQAMTVNSVLMIHIGEDLPDDSTATYSLTLRNFRFYAMSRGDARYVALEGTDRLLAAPAGGAVTLPTVGDVACWKDAAGVYPAGTGFSPQTSFTRLTPATLEEAAYAILAEAVKLVASAETTADRIAALEMLNERLTNDLLSETDSRYTAAITARSEALVQNGAEVDACLASAELAPDMEARFRALVGACEAYRNAQGLVAPATEAVYRKALSDYNALVDHVNTAVAETTTIAVTITVYRCPSVELVAILADIKSKIED